MAMSQNRRFIVAVAIRCKGMICSMSRPARHHNVIREMADSGIPVPINGEQGFLTSDGLFVDRKRALLIATIENQVIRKTGNSTELFSEDLW